MQTRRGFLKATGLAATAWAAGCATPGGSSPAPDAILVNGNVYTVDDRFPRAEAFAVSGNRFVAVGSTQDIRALAGSRTKVVDLGGATVVPGFIDAHTHPASAGISELRKVNCDVRSISGILERMAARAKKTPRGEWVLGFKYDDTKLAEGRPLNRKDLDSIIKDHPAHVLHRGGHTAIYNSVAFKLAGITKDTPDPEGGSFGRGPDGELTGFVAEKARYAFNKVAPLPPLTRADRRAGVKLVSERMAAAGLTSVHDASTSEADFLAYQDARAAGELSFRVYALSTPSLFESFKRAKIRTGFGDAWVRVGALKLFADGSCSERTMRMSTPYEGRPDYYGILTMNQEELNRTVEDAHRHEFQVGVHANGDVAIGMVLTAYERMLRLHPKPDARPRIEHCTLINDDLLKRMAAIGAIPTPFYTYVHFHGNKWADYGPKRLRSMFAHRSFLDYGIKVASASDYVPGPYEPLMAIQSMVTRKDFKGRVWGPNQKIKVSEALRICTMHGAYASFEEKLKGSITPGKLADYVVLAEAPHEKEPDRIKEIKVVRTVVGGRTTHSRG